MYKEFEFSGAMFLISNEDCDKDKLQMTIINGWNGVSTNEFTSKELMKLSQKLMKIASKP